MIHLVAISLLLAASVPVGAHESGVCGSPACPAGEVLDAVRERIAFTCDCAGAENAAKYMRCAKQVIRESLQAGEIE